MYHIQIFKLFQQSMFFHQQNWFGFLLYNNGIYKQWKKKKRNLLICNG